MRLLSHLEDDEKFFKYLRKDFVAFFPSAADEKVRGAAIQGRKNEKNEWNIVVLREDVGMDEQVEDKGEEEELFSDL